MKARILLAALTAAVLGVSATACGGDDKGDAGAQKLDFGYIADYNGSALLAIADQEKLWERNGLDPELKVFTNGPLQIQALGAGDLDFGYIGPGALWLPASGQAKVVTVNSLGLADRVIAQPGITSLADLKGKKVGVPEGTSGDMILTLALEKAGLTAKDIERVPMDPATVASAFASGQIDGAGIWYPMIDTIKKSVPDLVELAKNADFDLSFPSAYVTGADTAQKDPELVEKVVKVLQEASDYRSAHPAETVRATAAFLKLPEAQVTADQKNSQPLSTADVTAKTADGSVDSWLKGMSQLFVGAGKLKEVPEPSTYYLGDVYGKVAGK
ncbi:aliphatic sulfonate ABC transporter substrate-binding protein [Actinocorallia sp. API 0066]|uniref:aliphatic sulfonate ABC transporter substrate-binding protein n=1 Tax=Actinocorallia sp. API 0066 TaxID=2896846 RepID=UPI001E34CE80|nr:aliphatic sulfonate ABC transporter substrate-binding protein [Actinocorallia sp. API 0066]MCD0448950.1 aliphatic sulfonate ABC transporter substrate-binding protein [Actinocorallia sp. API 0066]